MITEAIITPNENHTIPVELRERPQWKVSDGKNAGSGWNIAANLRTYKQACDHASKIGQDGVIYIVLDSDPHTWIDLDNVRDPQTGDVEPWAQEIVDRLDSYTEVSGSGRGVHIAVQASKPGSRVKTQAVQGLEMYDDVRPMRVTGDRLNDKGIEPRQAEIEGLYHEVFPPEIETDQVDVEPTRLLDDEVLRLLTQVDPEAPKWRTTLNGDWGEHYTDQSGADFGIAYKLGFYSGDQEQVCRIMEASGLYRPKWDTRRPGGTLLTFTVGNAFDRLRETYNPSSDLRMTVGQGKEPEPEEVSGLDGWTDLDAVAAGGIKPTPQLVPGELYAGRVHLVHSKPGVGKTLWALLKSKELLNADQTVMYLDAENGPSMIVPRGKALGIRSFKNFKYNPSPEPNLSPQWVADFLHDVGRMKPDVVFIDSFADFLAGCGLDENSSMDVTRFYGEVLKPVRDQGVAVVILDHEPWESRGHARGSTAKLAKMDVEWEMRQTQFFNQNLVGELTLNLKKDRTAEFEHRTIKYSVGGPGLKFERSDGSVTDEGALLATRAVRKTAEALKGFGSTGATDSEWRTETTQSGIGSTAYYNSKKTLLESGRVVKNQDTRRFVHSTFAGGVDSAEYSTSAGGVDSTDTTEPRIDSGEKNSSGVKVESPEAATTLLHSTPGGLVPRSSGVVGDRGYEPDPDVQGCGACNTSARFEFQGDTKHCTNCGQEYPYEEYERSQREQVPA